MGWDITGFGSLFDMTSKVLDKIFPDKDAADKAKLELLKLQQDGAFKEMELEATNALEQLKVNAAEAANPSLFVSGWRPAVGWSAVSGCLYAFLGQPILSIWFTVPQLDTTVLTQLLIGMLGLGTLRTAEKFKGIARK